MAKSKLPFDGKYKLGSHVWHCISRTKGAWRLGEVIKINDADGYSSYNGIQVKQPHANVKRFLYGYSTWDVIARGAVPNVPNGTVYLVDTKIGETLSQRLGDNAFFSVFECGTRAMTKGNLLGYAILPCPIHEAENYHTNPVYQTWLVGPSVYELLSFLGQKLPEIIGTYKQLAGTNGQTNTTEDSNIEAD